MKEKQTILMIDDDPDYIGLMERLLRPFLLEKEVQFRSFTEPSLAVDYIEQHHDSLSVIITDYQMPTMNGIEFIRSIEHPRRLYQIIILSGMVDRLLTESALHLNIFDFIEKRTPKEEILEAVVRAHSFYLKQRETKNRLTGLIKSLEKSSGSGKGEFETEAVPVKNFHGIVGHSRAFEELKHTILTVAGSTATCLIQGESGTGKELVARAIHEESFRKGKPYTIINSGAIPGELMESELFGHAKGSFTGALADKTGLIEQTHQGTLFLDEITEMPLEMQVKLLRFLQEGTIQGIGMASPIHVDVRIIAATNRDTARAIEEGVLREDLFYRLNVIPIRTPPLWERKEDIELLIRHFIQIFSKLEDKAIRGYKKEILPLFRNYFWPGNIREMRNVVHRMVLFTESDLLRVKDIPTEILQYGDRKNGSPPPRAKPEQIEASEKAKGEPAKPVSTLKEMERESIVHALRNSSYNKEEAARILGISRASIYRKIKEYEIKEDE